MSAATLERVFEPFFTTKPVGQGTGLGLSQILGFARQSGGDVAIASTLGEGTTVSLYLPRHAEQAANPVPAPAPDLAPARIEGLIMVVEDDARVRAATGTALAELGYETILCASGAEAMERIDDQPIGLLMTDVVMPGMTGPELVERARARFPGLRVLFVTGYVGEAGEAEMFRDAAVLHKPFTLRALAKALAGVAASRTESGSAHRAA
jgi:CheY-like chemotaxis protein